MSTPYLVSDSNEAITNFLVSILYIIPGTLVSRKADRLEHVPSLRARGVELDGVLLTLISKSVSLTVFFFAAYI